jgi:hypothetical protein
MKIEPSADPAGGLVWINLAFVLLGFTADQAWQITAGVEMAFRSIGKVFPSSFGD